MWQHLDIAILFIMVIRDDEIMFPVQDRKKQSPSVVCRVCRKISRARRWASLLALKKKFSGGMNEFKPLQTRSTS